MNNLDISNALEIINDINNINNSVYTVTFYKMIPLVGKMLVTEKDYRITSIDYINNTISFTDTNKIIYTVDIPEIVSIIAQ